MDEELFTSSDDQQRHGHIIIKGKRTKRQRPSAAVTTSGSSSEGGRIFSGDDELIYESMTEEEEDMANCLILLAQGGGGGSVVVGGGGVKRRRNSDQLTAAEVAVVGIYGYECKTCNRTFQSFQALGGHRASHKRPKIILPNEKKSPLQFEHHHHHHGSYEDKKSISLTNSTTTLSLLHCSPTNKKSVSSSKVHECSICGAEFSSGQALGGHMRRHRTVTTTPMNNSQNQPPLRNHVMQLDLNLPAPDEDDRETNKFQFVFASPPPTLVDCHY